MIVDFRRTRIKSNSISIMGEDVMDLDNRLDWRLNTDAVEKKGQSRLYFWRKLRSFSVCSRMFISSISLLWRVQSYLPSSVGGAASEPETERN